MQESKYVPRRLYIKKTDVETHGMTAGCRGVLGNDARYRRCDAR